MIENIDKFVQDNLNNYKSLVVTLRLAKRMYESSDNLLRETALSLYPELGLSITKRVKTFEDACRIKGVNPDSGFFNSPKLPPRTKALRKLELVTEVLNETEDEVFFEDREQINPIDWMNYTNRLKHKIEQDQEVNKQEAELELKRVLKLFKNKKLHFTCTGTLLHALWTFEDLYRDYMEKNKI